MRWYEKIIAAHTSLEGIKVSHYRRLSDTRYIVWQEDGAEDFEADGRHAEKAMTGTTDLYTMIEFDPAIDALGDAYDAYGIAWRINSVQYEDETGIIHYEWAWSVKDGKALNNA